MAKYSGFIILTSSSRDDLLPLAHRPVVAAYAFYSLSEAPFKVLDILNGEIIDYDPTLEMVVANLLNQEHA